MKVATFLSFAGAMSFVSMSEAVLGRPKKPNVIRGPQTFHTYLTVAGAARRASLDLFNGYHLTATMEDSKWQRLTTAIERTLANFTYTVDLPNLHVVMSGVKRIEILDGLVVIRSARVVTRKGWTDTINLSVEIPKVAVTSEIAGCQRHPAATLDCAAILTIETLSFDLRAVCPTARDRAISSAEITKFNVGSIKLTAPADDYRSSATVLKSSLFWHEAVNAVKTGLRNRGIDNDLVKDFINYLLL